MIPVDMLQDDQHIGVDRRPVIGHAIQCGFGGGEVDGEGVGTQ